MRRYRDFIGWLGILVISCQSKPEELVFQPLKVRDTLSLQGTILCDSLLMKSVNDIGFNDSCLFIAAFSEEHFLHGYNRATGKPVGHFLRKGRGPGEIGTMPSFQIRQDSILSLFDPMNLKRQEYIINALMRRKSYPEKVI